MLANALASMHTKEYAIDENMSDAGYTPLHMAVGYSHVAVVAALLEAGANPEVQDRQSRDVIGLVESIREKMPISPDWMGKRMALEQVISLLGSELLSHSVDCTWITLKDHS